MQLLEVGLRGNAQSLRQSSLGETVHWTVSFAAELRADPCPEPTAYFPSVAYASLPMRPLTRADTSEMTMEATKALPKLAM